MIDKKILLELIRCKFNNAEKYVNDKDIHLSEKIMLRFSSTTENRRIFIIPYGIKEYFIEIFELDENYKRWITRETIKLELEEALEIEELYRKRKEVLKIQEKERLNNIIMNELKNCN